jgi:formylmethanofuran dehydrogenase subunit B
VLEESLEEGVQRWSDLSCPACGCVCDDVTLTVDGARVVSFEPRCGLGEAWFRENLRVPSSRTEVDGEPADMAAALETAASLLRNANYPLIYGLSRSATPGQRAAVALAEQLGAVIDTTASICHGPSIMALQDVGEATCTLGEIRNRADLVIFWGCHPGMSHPRHAERYSVFPNGRYVGRSTRTVVMVGDSGEVSGWRLDPTGSRPDLVVPIPAGQDFEALSLLRMMLHGMPPPDVLPELRTLMDLMRGARYGVVFFGLGLAETSMWDGRPHAPTGHVNVAALLQLVAELNSVTRFSARRMRLQGDVSGADNVLCWQTGFPFAVDLSRGYPRYNPGEFAANELLSCRNTDLCLMVGAETVPYFSPEAREYLRRIPTIVLDYPGAMTEFTPTVRFTTGVYGIHSPGTVYRMDNVPVSLRAPMAADIPTDESILNALGSRLAPVSSSLDRLRGGGS